jgi:hypothetical protein
VNNPAAYARLKLGMTFVLSIDGVPMIYSGDEIGLSGAGDPDNRRMMRWDDEVTAEEKDVREHFRKVAAVRNSHPALRYGSRRSLVAAGDRYAFVRAHLGDTVLAVWNRGDQQTEFQLEVAPEMPDDRCAEFFPPGSRTPFVEQVTIVADTPRAVQWSRPYPCPEGRFAAPEGAFLQGLVASPTDAAGEAVYPSNTAPNASLPVEVTACAASAFDWPEPPAGALPGLQLPDTRGTVRLEASVGEPLDVEVVGADRVTSVEVAFALAGFGGGSVAVAH